MEIQVRLLAKEPVSLSFFVQNAINKNVYRSHLVGVSLKKIHESFHLLPATSSYQIMIELDGEPMQAFIARPPHFSITVKDITLTADSRERAAIKQGYLTLKMEPQKLGISLRVKFSSFTVVLENNLIFYQNGPFRVEFYIPSKVGDLTVDSANFQCNRIVFFTCSFSIEFGRTNQLIERYFASHKAASVLNKEQLHQFTSNDRKFVKFSKNSGATDLIVKCNLSFEKCQTAGHIITTDGPFIISQSVIEKLDVFPIDFKKHNYQLPDQEFHVIGNNCAAYLPVDDFYCCRCTDITDQEIQDFCRFEQELQTDSACFELPSGNYRVINCTATNSSERQILQLKHFPVIRRRAVTNAGTQTAEEWKTSYEYKQIEIAESLAELAEEFSQTWEENDSNQQFSSSTTQNADFRKSEWLRCTRNAYIEQIIEPNSERRNSLPDVSDISLIGVNNSTRVRRSSELQESAGAGSSRRRASKIPVLSKRPGKPLKSPPQHIENPMQSGLTIEDLDDEQGLLDALESSRLRLQQLERYE